jgi:hypothetical protein
MYQVAPLPTYGIMYGMHRTTIYLPVELKARVAETAQLRGITEAEVIRAAIEQALDRPRPRGALFASGNPLDAERVDELLAETGFGEWQS